MLHTAKTTTILLVVILLTQDVFSFQREPEGFRDIDWGTDIETFSDKEMILLTTSENGEMKFYNRAQDKMTVADVPLDSVSYSFWRGKFMRGIITVKMSSCDLLLAAVTAQFGQPGKKLAAGGFGGYSAEWKGSKTNISVSKAFSCIATFESVALVDGLETEKKAAAEDQRPDF